MGYLFEFKCGNPTHHKILEVASSSNVTISENTHIELHYSVRLVSRTIVEQFATLSEFPGNCSSLVLDGIQRYCGDHGISVGGDILVTAAINICKSLSYGALFVSGTTEDMRNIMRDKYGFETFLDDLYNPHSGRNNFFMIKLFSKKAEPAEPVVPSEVPIVLTNPEDTGDEDE